MKTPILFPSPSIHSIWRVDVLLSSWHQNQRNKPSLTQKEESSAAAPQENLRLIKDSSALAALATPSISDGLEKNCQVQLYSFPIQPSGAIGYASATCVKRVRLKAQKQKRAKAAICMPNRNSPKLFHLPSVIAKNQQDDDTADTENQDDLDVDSIIPSLEFHPLKDLMREKYGTDNFLK